MDDGLRTTRVLESGVASYSGVLAIISEYLLVSQNEARFYQYYYLLLRTRSTNRSLVVDLLRTRVNLDCFSFVFRFPLSS